MDGVADIFTVGLGTHYVPADELATLREKLCSADFDGTSIQTVQTYLDKSTQKLEFSDTVRDIIMDTTWGYECRFSNSCWNVIYRLH